MIVRCTAAFLLICTVAVVYACVPVKHTEPGIPAVPACKKCDPTLINTDKIETGSEDFVSTDISTTGTCSVRTFVCAHMTIKYNGKDFLDGDDGTVDGKLNFAVTCSADGTAWLYKGAPVTGNIYCTQCC